ncbi:hypothetical protein ONZ51_g2646 [Trametes cubensis]|uniref:Heterokaryon incompatibility domain-containing protein n=1 Tax=Trametes cubensis TaxID=1111947 RepID=A0AAD7U0D7_9APHY|nr:hypothetical protein ONZ51_g2646 [Trametes cubensis]
MQIGNPAARWIKRRILIPHVGWPYALALAKTCIEECVRDHPNCQAITPYTIGDAPLPTRLIDCSDPDRLRIVETNSSVRGTYIALSYVWGEDQPHRTTKENLPSYKRRIDPAELPQTILDAIHVTRALGIDLLWVDGLCIVQDSDQDMHHELGRMRDVYRNAYVTIDASTAAKVSEGFLQDRELRPMPDAVLPFICPRAGGPAEQSANGTQLGMVYVKLGFNDDNYCTFGEYERDDPDSYTALRGWCLQERLLSTRLLIFNSETLRLRCHTTTHNIGGADHNGRHDTTRIPDAVFHPDRLIARHSDKWQAIHRAWLKIVEEYTRANLSNPEDKLNAISAVAEMFAPFLGPEYVAGLWRSSLLDNLLWESDDEFPWRRPTEYRGPSWSWASTDNPVSWGHYWKCDSLAEVVKCTVTLKNEKLPFGPVIGASLILRSHIFPCKWLVDKDVGGPTPMRRLSTDFSLPAPFPLKSRIDELHDDSSVEPQLWFLPLLVGHPTFVITQLHGLMVTRADPDVWRRSGAQGRGDVYRRVCEKTFWIDWNTHPFEDVEGRDEIGSTRMLAQIPKVDIELV